MREKRSCHIKIRRAICKPERARKCEIPHMLQLRASDSDEFAFLFPRKIRAKTFLVTCESFFLIDLYTEYFFVHNHLQKECFGR